MLFFLNGPFSNLKSFHLFHQDLVITLNTFTKLPSGLAAANLLEANLFRNPSNLLDCGYYNIKSASSLYKN